MEAMRPFVNVVLCLLPIALATSASAQPSGRRVTNLQALLAYPGFYHLKPITVAGTIGLGDDGQLRLTTDAGSIRVISREGAADGLSEARGEFWDLGRMNADDPRLAAYDLRQTFGIDPEGAWPRPGQVTAFLATTIVPTTVPAVPAIRTLVLHPSRFLDQTVTITGQFSGRNLLGELPDAPANSPYDFVLRSAEGAVWISNIRPRGRDFDLGLDARMDTNRWLQITGILHQARGLQWIDARDGTVELAKPATDTTSNEPVVVPAGPAPEVLFSAPSRDEIDVDLSTNIRIQFSRNIDSETLSNRVRVTYEPGGTSDAESVPSPVEITTEYRAASRVLEITSAEPLEPFRVVRVELLEGILGTDKQPLPPWSLTFTTGR